MKFHQFLIRAQELRNAGEYGEINAVTANQAADSIAQAEEFLELAQNAIGTLLPMRARNRVFLRKYFAPTRRSGKKPGFFGRSA